MEHKLLPLTELLTGGSVKRDKAIKSGGYTMKSFLVLALAFSVTALGMPALSGAMPQYEQGDTAKNLR
jgi:hypothetical protein